MKHFLFLFSTIFLINVSAQYKLSNENLLKGLSYLKDNAGFKDKYSVKLEGVRTSNFEFSKDCFTWAEYTVAAKNSFGAYGTNKIYVWFFDKKPFLCMESGDYPAYPYAANSNKAMDYILTLATEPYSRNLPSKFCPGELEKISI